MKNEDYLNDIRDIKSLMHRSSRFISLSGLSGILAGVYALLGSAIIYKFTDSSISRNFSIPEDSYGTVIITLAIIALLSIITAIFLTTQKAKTNNERIWNDTSKRLIINFLIPLVTGGVYILIVMQQQHFGYTAALMLVFYGLALLSASKHSIGDIKYLAFTEILLGLLCAVLPDYGFWLWAVGFGLVHILYGSWMYYKYDLKTN